MLGLVDGRGLVDGWGGGELLGDVGVGLGCSKMGRGRCGMLQLSMGDH